MKFKLGDKVKVTENKRLLGGLRVRYAGKKGEVIQIIRKIHYPYRVRFVGSNACRRFHASELELE